MGLYVASTNIMFFLISLYIPGMLKECRAVATVLLLIIRAFGKETMEEAKDCLDWAVERLIQGYSSAKTSSPQKGLDFLYALRTIFDLKLSTETSKQIPISWMERLATSVPNTLADVHGIPSAAFISLLFVGLVDDPHNYNSSEYIQRANELCKVSALPITLPLLAVCVCKEPYRKRMLQQLRDAGCSLEETSPANSAIRLLPPLKKKSVNEAKLEELHLRRNEASPLSYMVAQNDWE